MSRRLLVVRLDSMGDVLVCGPAIRAVAAAADSVTLLTGPLGEAAGRLLPGVDEVLAWNCPWIANPAPPVSAADVAGLVDRLAGRHLDEAVILTSFHQSALPTALLLRLAGVPRIVASSEDYPGSLLDLRLPVAGDGPEPERMLATVRAAGFELPPGDRGTLAVRLPAAADPLPVEPGAPYLVVHPGTTAAARAYPAERWAETVRLLVAGGWQVLVTGSAAERELTAGILAAARAGLATAAPVGSVAAARAGLATAAPVGSVAAARAGLASDGSAGAVHDLAGALDLAGLARLLAGAEVVLVANTGPAHLAAAVGTPVVSLFSPVVPPTRWAPYGVPVVLLGDQDAPCRDTRRTVCPVPGHPCLSDVAPATVVAAVEQVAGQRPAVAVSG